MHVTRWFLPVGGFLQRHERLLWTLHSLWAMALGVVVMWLGSRNYAWLRVTLFYVAFLWLTSLFVPSLVNEPGQPSRWRGVLRYVINYFHKNFYQQLLFFLLPVYYASATPWSPNMLFVVFLAGSALVSTLDVFYDRHLSVRRGLLAIFFAFNLFACINVLLPTLWSISHRVALPLSAGLAMAAFATIRFRLRDLARFPVRLQTGLAAIALVLVVGFGRPLIPPAPLKVLSHVAHWTFYAVLAIMSVSGALAWFADLTVAAQVHNVFKVILLALIALHVLAIPFHRVVLKNNVMIRMIRPAE